MSKKNNHRRDVSVETKKPPLTQKKQQPNPTEKKPLSITTGGALCIAIIVTMAVAVLGYYYLIVRNSDMLYMAQSKSFFCYDQSFYTVCMQRPGGFITWVSSYLTQFFYYPKLGSAIMAAIWVASIWLSKIAFKVKMAWMAVLAIPAVCLLVSTIDTGYWLYYMKQTGYWFYGTVGYFFTLVMILFHSCFKTKTIRIITTLLIAVTYPCFGWYTLLALLYITILSLSNLKKEDTMVGKIILPSLPIVLIGITPYICYNFYSTIRFEDMWIVGFPLFENNDMVSFTPSIPFVVLAAVPLLFPFLPKKVENSTIITWTVSFVTIIVLVLSWLWVDKNDFQNYNYHAEMRMYRAAEEQD